MQTVSRYNRKHWKWVFSACCATPAPCSTYTGHVWHYPDLIFLSDKRSSGTQSEPWGRLCSWNLGGGCKFTACAWGILAFQTAPHSDRIPARRGPRKYEDRKTQGGFVLIVTIFPGKMTPSPTIDQFFHLQQVVWFRKPTLLTLKWKTLTRHGKPPLCEGRWLVPQMPTVKIVLRVPPIRLTFPFKAGWQITHSLNFS